MTKEKRNTARLPTSSGSQMTKECIRDYLSTSSDEFTMHVAKKLFGSTRGDDKGSDVVVTP